MSPSTSRSHISNPRVRWWSISSITISSWCTSTYRRIWIFSIFTLSTVLVSLSLPFSSSSSLLSPSSPPSSPQLPPFPPFSLGGGLGGGCSSPCPFLFPLPLILNVPHVDFLGGGPPILSISLDGVLVVGLDGHWAPPPPQLVSHGVSFPLVVV